MELQQLRYFVEIARQESMTRAARILYVSQPSLSQCIRRLEDELGVSLFQREDRKLRLTGEGRTLYAGAERILRELDSTCTALKGQTLQGHIMLGTYLPITPLLECLRSFTELYPDVTFGIYSLTAGLAQMDLQKLELLLCYEQSDPLDFSGRIAVGKVQGCFVLPAGHPLAGREFLTAQDMENESFASLAWGTGEPEELFQDFAHGGVSPRIRYLTNSFSVKKELLEAGLVAGSSNDMLLEEFAPDGKYVAIPHSKEPVSLYLGWRALGYLSPAAQNFVRFAQGWFSDPTHCREVK